MTPGVRQLAAHLGGALLGFLVGAVALYVLWARSGPPLRPWHTVELETEFSAGRAGIRTLEDYVGLEEALFVEVEERVGLPHGAAPGKLLRYVAGSPSDPRRWSTDWNRTFELPVQGARGGVLLLHGMSDSPYSLRALGLALRARGHHVVGLRMPGHGTAPSGLTRVRVEDMGAAVKLGMHHLAEELGDVPIHLVGYSTGAPLALGFALEALEGRVDPKPASLVLISPAVGVSAVAGLAKWQRRLARLPGLEKLAWTQVLPEFDPFRYNSFTTNAAEQVHRLTSSVAAGIASRAATHPARVLPPTLVLLSAVDATVSTDAVHDRLLAQLAPHRHRLVLFDINRAAVRSRLVVTDPGPSIEGLLADDALPYALTLVTNESPESGRVVARRKPARSRAAPSSEPIARSWPPGVISLSHVALPFPPADPLYGRRPPGHEDLVFLGQTAIRGERGVLGLSGDWLLRLRHNPFYDFLEASVLEWVEDAEERDDGA